MNRPIDRATLAVDRRLAQQQQAAQQELERILVAAMAVTERAFPDSPRIVDIVAEANISNQTFYRYFASKADLTLAVFEWGVARVVTYLRHQIEKVARGGTSDPASELRAWINGVMAQVAHPGPSKTALATMVEIGRIEGEAALDSAKMIDAVRELLLDPLVRLGSTDVDRDADAIYEIAFGTMHRHLFARTRPAAADVDHIVAFCLRGIGARG